MVMEVVAACKRMEVCCWELLMVLADSIGGVIIRHFGNKWGRECA